ncbi:hypothetical protein QWY31_11190 [Cytophagales bacterium LB-30]|uniref:Dienelactone hydrolase n=1 Tax=Shiella aurantiaca TaxID=3058365 RepID=A0ABT8F6R6_9BACT|nr:hypothetical protein [Shiella aurantiaca]MDN4166070.1 hypothetical protein [Shiella aurantiaca]
MNGSKSNQAIKLLKATKVLFLFLVLLSCSKGEDSEPKEDETKDPVTEDPITETSISIDPGTASLLLEVKNQTDGATVPVYIALPPNETGPLKGVVVLHGSGGPWADEDTDNDGIADLCHVGEPSRQTREWRDLLIDQKYLAAFPDSYSPRGTCENEGDYKNPPLKFKISGTFIRNGDALAVLELLRNLVWADSKLPIVDPDNIAVVGFSDGGTAAISTVFDAEATPEDWVWKQSFSGEEYTSEIFPPVPLPSRGGYKAGVFYYAGAYHNGYYGSLCSSGKGIYKTYCNVLVHLPLEDPLTENAECLISTMEQNGGGNALVYRYEGLGHGFDGNDEPESTEARNRTIDFLREQLDN